jgi:hypothetical protein
MMFPIVPAYEYWMHDDKMEFTDAVVNLDI